MRLPSFVLPTTVGSAIWNTVFIVGGYVLGEEWHRVEETTGWLQWVVRRVRSRRAAGSSAGP